MLLSQIIKEMKLSKKFVISIISGIVTQLFFAIFRIYTITAFVSQNELLSPMSVSQTITYIWMTQFLFMIVPWNINWKDFDSIRTGTISIDLIRPVSIFNSIFSKTFSWRLVGFLVRSVPMFIIVLLIFPIFNLSEISIILPKIYIFFFFLISIFLSTILSSLITVSIYSLCFIFTSISNFIGLITSLTFMLSGMIIPLSFYPKELVVYLKYQPFKFIVDTPALIFNGVYDYKEIFLQIMIQLIWIFIFYKYSKKVYEKFTSRLEIYGG
ncbi:ABC transporter permease [Streptobacillus ratti]|uniref:ABC transporter permease n=1 Tax=Streptobacillus ratti TaxID=1720557 RepID=UPI000933528F|nr:ABC-2 family transporter protein [Streptobacillus ratti]